MQSTPGCDKLRLMTLRWRSHRSSLRKLAGTLNAILVLGACLTATVAAQWVDVVTRGVPRTPLGTPNYGAPTPKMADGKTPDLSGIWEPATTPCDEERGFGKAYGCNEVPFGFPIGSGNINQGGKDKLPLQPWAEALSKQRTDDLSKDNPYARCLPPPGPRAWAQYLQKMIQTQDSVVILDEYMAQYRQIFLDGRPLPEDPQPTFKGYSVGKWEGETLVVETLGFKDNQWLDGQGRPLTDQARTIERIRRVNYGNLEVEITVDDPKAYTKPWTVTRNLFLVINTELLDYICNENERDLKHLVGKGDVK